MSYSVSAQGATKAEALDNILKQLDGVAETQSTHKADIGQVKIAVTAFVELLPDPNSDEQVSVQANGYLSWQGSTDEPRFTGAHVSVTAGLVKKEAA